MSLAAYFRHVLACNPPISEPFVPWRVDDQLVGWMRPVFVEKLRDFAAVFELRDDEVRLDTALRGFDERSMALGDVVRELAQRGVTPPYMDEPYAVTSGGRESALCTVDRAAASYFGVRSFGQHLNGFVRKADGIHMWLGRRARDRLLFPGALDNMVAGGLPYGVTLADNLLKECAEEAAVPANLAGRALAVGAVSYIRVAERGLRRDVLYCYDLELPADFEPRNTDGEVESFMLLPIDEVAEIVRDSDEFKLNCNLVVIDFLLRHGFLEPQSAGYLDLALGLRQGSDMLENPCSYSAPSACR